FAEDAAGNEGHQSILLRYVNPSDQPPIIDFLEAERSWAPPGGAVMLRWKVRGTRPIQLELGSWLGEVKDVTGRTSAVGIVTQPDIQVFGLSATNEHGQAYARVYVGVGEALQIWPQDATVLSGV